MDPAVAGLIGASVGALTGLAGLLVNARAQGRREHAAFRLQRKADAYGVAVGHLFRAAARRSNFTAEGTPLLSKEDQAEWFLDVANALQSLTTVVSFAGPGFRHELLEVLQHYGHTVFELTQKGLKGNPKTPNPVLGFGLPS